MITNNGRFKVNALIQMARTTENQELRERYIAQAESILEDMDATVSNVTSAEMFLMDKCDLSDNHRIERTALYKKFEEYCADKKLSVCSRNVFYATLRENKVKEIKTNGYRYFVVSVSK